MSPCVASAGGDRVVLWSPPRGTGGRGIARWEQRPGAEPTALAWNGTGQVLAAGTAGGGTAMLHAVSGVSMGAVPEGAMEVESGPPVAALGFSKGNRYLAAAGGREVKLWDLKRKQCQRVLGGHTTAVTALAYSPGEQTTVASADAGGAIVLHSHLSGLRTAVLGHKPGGRVHAVAYAATGAAFLAAGGHDGAVRVWDCATRLQHAALEGAHGGLPCHAVCFAPDHPQLLWSAGADARLVLHDLSRSPIVPAAAEVLRGSLRALAASPDGVMVVAGDSSGRLTFFDTRQLGTPLWEATHGAPVTALAWQPVATASAEELNASQHDLSALGTPRRGGGADGDALATTRMSLAGLSPIVDVPPLTPQGGTAARSLPSLEELQAQVARARTPMRTPSRVPVDAASIRSTPSFKPPPQPVFADPEPVPVAQVHVPPPAAISIAEPLPAQRAISSAAAAAAVAHPGVTLDAVRQVVEESVGALRATLHEEVRNVHLELLQQAHLQQQDAAAQFAALYARQGEILDELRALRLSQQPPL